MRIAEVKVYAFDELSPKAKERAIEKARQHLNETWDGDLLKESFKALLEERGLPTEKIYFSLSHCQGDGVGFYGDVDLETFSKWKNLSLPEGFSDAFHFIIEKRDNHYDHEYTGYADWEEWGIDRPEDWVGLADGVKLELQEAYRDTSRQLAREGYEELDYENSDEYIIEFIQGNDYEYEENGEMF